MSEEQKEAKELEIPGALGDQEHRIEKLNEQINELNARLERVSRERSGDQGIETPDGTTEIGSILKRHNCNIQELEEKIVDIMSRLEI